MGLTASFGKPLPRFKRFIVTSDFVKGENVPAASLDLTKYEIDVAADPNAFVLINGRMLDGGNVTTKNDVCPGDNPGAGDLKIHIDRGIHTGDLITTLGFRY